MTQDQFKAPYHIQTNEEHDNDNKGKIFITDNHGDLIGTAIDLKRAAQFAASSEMLDALKAAKKRFDISGSHYRNTANELVETEAYTLVCAAIAKAQQFSA